jgi:hypothetical protein
VIGRRGVSERDGRPAARRYVEKSVPYNPPMVIDLGFSACFSTEGQEKGRCALERGTYIHITIRFVLQLNALIVYCTNTHTHRHACHNKATEVHKLARKTSGNAGEIRRSTTERLVIKILIAAINRDRR